MKVRMTALVLALVLALGTVPALAQEPAEGEAEDQGAASAQDQTDTAEGEAAQESSPAGPDQDEAEMEPDPEGTVRFASLERRIRESNLQIQALDENIAALEELDYEDLEEDLREQLNRLASEIWDSSGNPIGGVIGAMYQQQYDAMREQFDALRDGELQEDNAGLAWQLRNLQDQIVMGGETLYTALASMEIQARSLERQLDAMDRTVEEMELRHELGQISALQLQQTKAGRTSLASGLETLRMNLTTYKLQLELLLGEPLAGTIVLDGVPEVTEEQLDAMDLEQDLDRARENSYELYAAEQDLEDARETYRDTGAQYGYRPGDSNYTAALHTWQAAQYTYEAAKQDYELRFRTLYAQVRDYAQVLEAARTALESQRAACEAQELKFRQGTISQNTLLTARDDLAAAEETVEQAEDNLFTAYNSYCWAVEHGILN